MVKSHLTPSIKKALIGAGLVLLLTQMALQGMYLLIERDHYIQYRAFASGRLNDKIEKLEDNLNNIMIIPVAISTFINLKEELDTAYLYQVAENYVKNNSLIRNIAVAPNSVIHFVYPYAGNAQAIGIDLANHPKQGPDVKKAIQTKQTVISGPVELVQGGKGIVIRSPIFYNKPGNNSYWGIISLVIDYQKLLKYLTIETRDEALVYSIRELKPALNGWKTIYGDSLIFFQSPVKQNIRLLGNNMWEIAAVPQAGWKHIKRVAVWVYVVGNLLSFLIAFLTFLVVHRHFYQRSLLKHNKQLVAELNSTLALKNKFFSIIAHDLRSPFNALLALTEQLIQSENEMKPKEKQELMSYINQSSNKLYELSHNLLTWAQTQTRQIKFEPRPENITHIIQDSLHYSQTMLITKKIDVAFEPPKEDILCICDKNMIGTVVRNLLSNAIKFSPQNSTIQIELHKDTKFIRLIIRDRGIGMSPETLSNLFKIENTTSTSGTEGEKGTGLGLILCKEFIDKHKGEIKVQSHKDQGTSIEVLLPLA